MTCFCLKKLKAALRRSAEQRSCALILTKMKIMSAKRKINQPLTIAIINVPVSYFGLEFSVFEMFGSGFKHCLRVLIVSSSEEPLCSLLEPGLLWDMRVFTVGFVT